MEIKSNAGKTARKVFVVALLVTLCLSILNWGVVSQWGDIKITPLRVVGHNGAQYTALMYVPSSATAKTPAPALLTMHGASGNARNHEEYAIEYARRGFVVLSIDNYASGDSTMDPDYVGQWKYDVGDLFWEYMIKLDIVDPTRTVISGHSIGSTGTLHMAAYKNPTVAVPVDGFMGVYPAKDDMHYTGMICAISGRADSQNTLPRLEPLLGLFKVDPTIVTDDESLQLDHMYGSFEEKNAKIVYTNDSGHEDAMINKMGMQQQLDFVQNAMVVPHPIAGSDQVWMYKDYVSLFGMFSFSFMLMALAVMLIENTAWFSSIKNPIPRNIGLRGIGMAISVACAVIFPVLVLKTGAFGLTQSLQAENLGTKIFDMGRGNRAFTVVIGLSLLGFLTLLLFIFTDGKKHKAGLREYGLTSEGKTGIDWMLILKSAVLTLVVLFAGFAYLRWQREVFGTDFYAWYYGFKPIAWNKFMLYIPYLVVWCLCFILASIGMNVERRLPSTGNDTKDMILQVAMNVVLNCAVLFIVVGVQWYLQHNVDFLARTSMSDWGADLTRLWGMPAGMAIGAFGHTYLFRKTGSIWPGVFLMGCLCALSCVLYGSPYYC